jgi:hypothetical protein
MTLASSSRADIIGNVLPLSLEAPTITSTGAVGVNISESVVNFTAIDEHMVLVRTFQTKELIFIEYGKLPFLHSYTGKGLDDFDVSAFTCVLREMSFSFNNNNSIHEF